MKITNIKVKTLITKQNVILIGFLFIRDKDYKINRENIKLKVNKKSYKIIFPFKRIKCLKIIEILSNFYIVKIPINDLIKADMHNKTYFEYENEEIIKSFSLRYSIFSNKSKYLNTSPKIIKHNNTTIYARQSVKNRLIITVRKTNITDKLKERIKINLACLFSKFIPKRKILMYEKEAERYEESASILYEKLLDEGYKNIYYIIDKYCPKIKYLDEKYKKNFIYKYTFKHYLAFFSAKALIGTELPRTCYRVKSC